ncbi:MAG: lipoate--protein ligase family protein [Chloroflexi bacterium]|nr:lipoate--protein ligase family protein [Chloroflexota bacterium]
MSGDHWRLLISGTADGATNMAVDHAIMEAVAEGRVPSTLRFYAWQPACLSLGYTQPAADVDLPRLAGNRWDVVRRLTGGRAILHTDELTYSVATKAAHPLVAGDIVESYRRLSQALLEGLRIIGATAQADKRSDGSAHTSGPVCFEVPSHYEITVDGKKLLGSAQVRRFGAVLQHGALPLSGDIARICDALFFETEQERELVRRRVRGRATTAADILGQTVSWENAVEAMIGGFERVFNLSFETTHSLTTEEQARADDLYTEQYTAESWIRRF